MSIPETVAVILALAYVMLAIVESRFCWLAGGVSALLYIVVFTDARLYMEAGLQGVYIAMANSRTESPLDSLVFLSRSSARDPASDPPTPPANEQTGMPSTRPWDDSVSLARQTRLRLHAARGLPIRTHQVWSPYFRFPRDTWSGLFQKRTWSTSSQSGDSQSMRR